MQNGSYKCLPDYEICNGRAFCDNQMDEMFSKFPFNPNCKNGKLVFFSHLKIN